MISRNRRALMALFVTAGIAAGASAGAAVASTGPTLPPTDEGTAGAEATTTTSTVPGPTLPPLPTPIAPPTDNEPEPQQYFGRIQIPAIDVDAPFIDGIRLSTLDYGPGHWPGTAMPGEMGNVVVAGHRTSHNADFRRLDELVPGDEVIFDLDDAEGIPTATVVDPDPYSGVYVYTVHSVEIVGPEAMWIVAQDYRHEATLFACHPPGSVAERIVVHLDLVSVNGEPADVSGDVPRPTTTTAAPTG